MTHTDGRPTIANAQRRPRAAEVTPEWLRGRADEMHKAVDGIRERADRMERACTCTLACIPQGLEGEQVCRLSDDTCCGDPGDCGMCPRGLAS